MADSDSDRRLGAMMKKARQALQQAGITEPAKDARLLAAGATGLDGAHLVARPDWPVGKEAAGRFDAMIERRVRGEPVHRILGYREFYGLRLSVSAATLEPRPDTETLVDLVLPHVRDISSKLGICRLLDLGTGTGAIALAVLAEEQRSQAVATDISPDAISTARDNAQTNGLEVRLETIVSDWFENVIGRFHLVVANPPYIPTGMIDSLDRDVRCHDPHLALDGGRDGLDAYRRIAADVGDYLHKGGMVAVEVGHTQADDVSRIFERQGLCRRETGRDLGGVERALLFAG